MDRIFSNVFIFYILGGGENSLLVNYLFRDLHVYQGDYKHDDCLHKCPYSLNLIYSSIYEYESNQFSLKDSGDCY